MPVHVPTQITDQAAAEKLLRDLADSHNAQEGTIDALKEANQRLEERLASVGRGKGPEAEAVARYQRPDGKLLLRGVEVRMDGREVELAYAEEGSVEPSIVAFGYLDDPNPRSDLQREIQDAVSRRNIARHILGAQRRMRRDDRPVTSEVFDAQIRRLGSFLPEPMRRTFNGSAGAGSEWIPTDVYPELVRAQNQLYEYMLPGQFPEVQVQRSGPIPLLTRGFLPYIQSAASADPAQMLSSDAATSSTSVSLKTLAALTLVGMDAAEESLFPVMSEFTYELALALMRAREDAIINGQLGTTSVDTGLASWNPDSVYPVTPGGSSADHRYLWAGLRHKAIDASKATDRGTFTFATWGADRAAVKGPKPPGSMLYIGSETGLWKNFYVLDQIATMEKMGAAATVVSGGPRVIAGSLIFESQFMTDDLNTAGIFDNATMTKTGALHVLRTAYRRLTRYGARVFSQVDETRGVIYIGAKSREDFKQAYTSDTPVHYEYNLAKS